MSRLAFTAALALSLQLGCTLNFSATATDSDSDSSGSSTSGGLVCEDPNAELVGSTCFCKIGYTWCNPSDPDDLSCCEEGVTTGPVSTVTTDPTGDASSTTSPVTSGSTSDGSTSGSTSDGSTTDGSTSDGTTGGPVCPGPQPPPDGCNDGSYWCTVPEVCGPAESELYRCVGGAWTLDDMLAKQSCLFDGYDFTYGCVDGGKDIEFLCGDGPGTPCVEGDPSACVDDKTLSECKWNKTTHYDCFTICTEQGDSMGVLYDYGYCGEDMGQTGCLCCDMGEPGCPI